MHEYTYSYERAAMHGEPMPDGLDIVDQLTFLRLRSLYAQVKAGTIDRATGTAEKGKLRYQHDLWERRLLSQEKLSQKSADMFKDIEGAANAYAKDRTIENADKLYKAIYRTVL